MRRCSLDAYKPRDVVRVGDALVATGAYVDNARTLDAISLAPRVRLLEHGDARRVPLSAHLVLVWEEDAGLVDRLARIYDAWGPLTGPHLVPVVERGVFDWPTVAAQLVVTVEDDDADLDLDDVCGLLFAEKEARPPAGVALVVAAQLAHAFAEAAASARTPTHGDLRLRFTPPALRFAWDGAVRLSARPTFVDERRGPRILELPEAEYLAPEELPARDIRAGRDAWVVGVVLHRLLCGRTPFGGGASPMDVVRAIHDDRRRSRASALRPDVAPAVHAIVERCLARDAIARPSCGELAALLDDAAHSEGFAARDVGAVLAQLAPRAWSEGRAFREALALAPPPDARALHVAERVRVVTGALP